MVDKIIANFESKIYDSDLADSVLATKDARLLFLFAYYFNDKIEKEKFETAILATNNLRYIAFYFRSVEVINKDLFITKILSFNDAKSCYYLIYDNDIYVDNYIERVVTKLLELKDQLYLFKLAYYYFNVLRNFNSYFFDCIKEILESENIAITRDNMSEVLEKIKKDKMTNFLPSSNVLNTYTSNCYEGHDELIPDMIVLHISSDYETILRNFYDPKLEVSAHFVIKRDGKFYNPVDLANSAWANGTSLSAASDVYYKFSSNELVRKRAINANYYTFSIEHESYDGTLTKEQFNTSVYLIKRIIKYVKDNYNYDFLIDKKHIVGHQEVNPIVRNKCPGSKFPIAEIIRKVKTDIREELF